jgi:hypothetical protein
LGQKWKSLAKEQLFHFSGPDFDLEESSKSVREKIEKFVDTTASRFTKVLVSELASGDLSGPAGRQI